jgi:hypothetical protein
MPLQTSVIVKRALMGMIAGILLGVFSLLYKKRQMLKTGVGIEVKFLHFDKHLFDLLRKMRPLFKTKLSVYNFMIQSCDNLVGAVVQQTPIDTAAVHETMDLMGDPHARKAVQELLDKVYI